MRESSLALQERTPIRKTESYLEPSCENNTSFGPMRLGKGIQRFQTTRRSQRVHTNFQRDPNCEVCRMHKTIRATFKSRPLKHADRISPPTPSRDPMAGLNSVLSSRSPKVLTISLAEITVQVMHAHVQRQVQQRSVEQIIETSSLRQEKTHHDPDFTQQVMNMSV